MSTVKTSDVRNRIIGDARKAFDEAAGSNEIISKTEQKALPKDLKAAVTKARKEHSRVTVDDAVDVYASKVARTLAAVDRTDKGALSETEANNIRDGALRLKVLDVRAALAAGDDVTVDDSGYFVQFKPLVEGASLLSGGGVESGLKAFTSGAAIDGALDGALILEQLAPKWEELGSGLLAGEDLDTYEPGLHDAVNIEPVFLAPADVAGTLDDLASRDEPFPEIVQSMRDNLTDLCVVDLYARDDDGNFSDVGHHGCFVGGKDAAGHLVGFFTGIYVE